MRSFILLLFVTLPSLIWSQQTPQKIKLINGHWFNGQGFEQKTIYSINGVFVTKQVAKVDTVIDLSGKFIVPPFADAHNHNIGTGAEELDRKAIRKYIEGGVFYVKIQGNLPITVTTKKKLGINMPTGIDVLFSQGTVTATGGMPIMIVEKIHPMQGFNKGYSNEQLKDFRYFTVDNEKELEEKWPKIIAQNPDFIKTFLWRSGDYEKLKNDTSVFFKGIDPALVPKIVSKAHAQHLKVSVHVTNAIDFHHAVITGADEITHLPRFLSGAPNKPIAVEDAQLAAKNKITVITTAAVSLFQGGMVKEADRQAAKQYQADQLKLLSAQGVPIAIGSDDIADNSVKEVFYLKSLGVFDNLALLKLWTEATAKAIFPKRKIGLLQEGYEASFLALEGNPIEDFENVKKIKFRFKQGTIVPAN